MDMTIDEAIAHAREVSTMQRNNDKLNKTLGVISPYYKADCIKCAEEHEQLAEWLEELKKRRSEDYGYMADIHQSIGYRKALDDIKEELMKNGFICTQHALDVFDGIAKLLKEGN